MDYILILGRRKGDGEGGAVPFEEGIHFVGAVDLHVGDILTFRRECDVEMLVCVVRHDDVRVYAR